jgi:hypothetical protein
VLSVVPLVVPGWVPDKATRSVVSNLAVTSPLVRGFGVPRLTIAEFRTISQRLGLPPENAPAQYDPTAPRAHLNVVLVVLESSYNRYLSLSGRRTKPSRCCPGIANGWFCFQTSSATFPTRFTPASAS